MSIKLHIFVFFSGIISYILFCNFFYIIPTQLDAGTYNYPKSFEVFLPPLEVEYKTVLCSLNEQLDNNCGTGQKTVKQNSSFKDIKELFSVTNNIYINSIRNTERILRVYMADAETTLPEVNILQSTILRPTAEASESDSDSEASVINYLTITNNNFYQVVNNFSDNLNDLVANWLPGEPLTLGTRFITSFYDFLINPYINSVINNARFTLGLDHIEFTAIQYLALQNTFYLLDDIIIDLSSPTNELVLRFIAIFEHFTNIIHLSANHLSNGRGFEFISDNEEIIYLTEGLVEVIRVYIDRGNLDMNTWNWSEFNSEDSESEPGPES